jgi:hypothetical protein
MWLWGCILEVGIVFKVQIRQNLIQLPASAPSHFLIKVWRNKNNAQYWHMYSPGIGSIAHGLMPYLAVASVACNMQCKILEAFSQPDKCPFRVTTA